MHKYVPMSIFMLDPILPRDLCSRGGNYAEGRPSDIYFPFSSFTVTPLAEPMSLLALCSNGFFGGYKEHGTDTLTQYKVNINLTSYAPRMRGMRRAHGCHSPRRVPRLQG